MLEVLPGCQGQDIGKAMLTQILNRLKYLYAFDLICDPEMLPFYEKAGLMVRHYQNQAGSDGQWRAGSGAAALY